MAQQQPQLTLSQLVQLIQSAGAPQFVQQTPVLQLQQILSQLIVAIKQTAMQEQQTNLMRVVVQMMRELTPVQQQQIMQTLIQNLSSYQLNSLAQTIQTMMTVQQQQQMEALKQQLPIQQVLAQLTTPVQQPQQLPLLSQPLIGEAPVVAKQYHTSILIEEPALTLRLQGKAPHYDVTNGIYFDGQKAYRLLSGDQDLLTAFEQLNTAIEPSQQRPNVLFGNGSADENELRRAGSQYVLPF